MSRRDRSTHHLPRVLGGSAALLAAMAAVVGDPGPRRARPRLDIAALAGVIERQEDHVTALELAEWIRDRKPGLRVADVRTRAEFDEYHIPSAGPLALSSIATMVPDGGETWVLYSEGGAHAAQAWALMRAVGFERVYFLRGGILDWAEEVMNPELRPAPTEEARRANERVASLSRYFGGVPRVVGSTHPPERGEGAEPAVVAEPPRNAAESTNAIARTRRRGC